MGFFFFFTQVICRVRPPPWGRDQMSEHGNKQRGHLRFLLWRWLLDFSGRSGSIPDRARKSKSSSVFNSTAIAKMLRSSFAPTCCRRELWGSSAENRSAAAEQMKARFHPESPGCPMTVTRRLPGNRSRAGLMAGIPFHILARPPHCTRL